MQYSTIAGKRYPLRKDVMAMLEVEDKFGVSLLNYESFENSSIKYGDLVRFVYKCIVQGLLKEGTDSDDLPTLEDVVSGADASEVNEALRIILFENEEKKTDTKGSTRKRKVKKAKTA